MLANDPKIAVWIYGIVHGEPVPAGGFLSSFADAVLRADPGCYWELRPAIRMIMRQFPKYRCNCQGWEQPQNEITPDVSQELSPRQEMRAKVINILGAHYNQQISIGAVEAILDATGLKDEAETDSVRPSI